MSTFCARMSPSVVCSHTGRPYQRTDRFAGMRKGWVGGGAQPAGNIHARCEKASGGNLDQPAEPPKKKKRKKSGGTWMFAHSDIS